MSHAISRPTMWRTILLAWGGVRGGSHWPCPWSAHRSCLMILGPPGWSVLHCHSPDALSLSLACATAANVSGDSLVRAKIGISSWNLVASRVTRWHRGAKWLSGRVDGLPATQVARGPVAPPVAANWASKWTSRRDPSVSALNSSQDCPHTGIMYLYARARAKVCARDQYKDDSTPIAKDL